MKVEVRIQGIVPLVLDATKLWLGPGDPPIDPPAHQAGHPRDVAEHFCWRDDDGVLAIPSAMIVAAIANGGRMIRGYKPAFSKLAQAHIGIESDMVPFIDHNGHPARLFELHLTGRTQPRPRPKIWLWSAEFTLEIDDTVLSVSDVYDALLEAGRHGVGICREPIQGGYGRFDIVRWKATPDHEPAVRFLRT